jgi:rhodanese-related sulfurtransferase
VPTEIDLDEVRALLDAGTTLIDVLPAEDFVEEHLPLARNVPLKGLDERAVGELDRSRPVIVYCADDL